MANIVDGQPFGPYTIVSKLGRGGMASVYRAYESKLDRTVALKVLPEDLLDQPGFLDRFEREARVIAHLEHPHIVPVYATGIDEGQPWMALRLVRGGNLAERMEEGEGLGRESGLRYLGNIAEALDFAHAKGIVHRDLKPQNILLGERDECYIADFGIASLLSGTTRLTQTGTALGTPQYMAPEQAKGEAVGSPADIYALGIIAYHWLAGELPFDADTPYAVMFKHVSSPLPMEPLRSLSDRAQEVMARVLAKQPADRWASAGEFISSLADALGEPMQDVPKAKRPNTAGSPRAARPLLPFKRAAESRPARNAEAGPSRSIRGRFAAIAAMLFVALGIWGGYRWWQAMAGTETTPLAAVIDTPLNDTDRIRQIQRDLIALGYRVSENGEADVRTTEVIKQFEAQQGLAVTGAPDGVLAQALQDEIKQRDGEGRPTTILTLADTSTARRTGQRNNAQLSPASEVEDVDTASGVSQAPQQNEATRLAEEMRKADHAKRSVETLFAEEQRSVKPSEEEGDAWLRAAKEDTEASYEAYVRKYPQGLFINELTYRLTQAKEKAAETASSAQSTTSAFAARATQEDFEDLGNGRLRDSQTGLIWTRVDNGRDINWNAAKSYCEAKGERLPSFDELANIGKRVGSETTICGIHRCKVSPKFRLTGAYIWSGTKIDSTQARFIDFRDGASDTGSVGIAYFNRALCVSSL